MIVEHPASGTRKTVLGSWHRLWSLLFSCIYYAVKGMWGWAVLSFLTFNGLWILFPLWNRTIVRSHYENKGWRVYEDIVEFSAQSREGSGQRRDNPPPLGGPGPRPSRDED